MKQKKQLILYATIKAKDLTHRKLAIMVGVHESVISNIINGRMIPSDAEKVKIAEALGTEPEIIFV